MKLKMAPNSLFAVLLRSPWWISMTIGVLLGAAAFALLPEQYKVVGSASGMPFVIISVVALWQQMRLPSAGRSEAILRAIAAMSWPQFSALLEEGFAKQGYRVERLQQGPADFLLTRAGRTTLVAARRWKAARHGEESLQALQRAAQSQDASHCLYVALGDLSANAQYFVKRHQVQLMQGAALAYLLQHAKLPTT